MTGNDWIWQKILESAGNCKKQLVFAFKKCQTWLELAEYELKQLENCWKYLEMAVNSCKCLEMAGNGWTFMEMVQNGDDNDIFLKV